MAALLLIPMDYYCVAVVVLLILLVVVYFLLNGNLIRKHNKNSEIPMNWPVIGMFIWLVKNVSHVHDILAILLKNSSTIEIKGIWLANMDRLITADPKNVKHILYNNFANYPKGPSYKEIFEPFGNGFLNTDFDMWKIQKRMLQSILRNRELNLFMEKTFRRKVVDGLIPILDQVSRDGKEVDLNEIFERLMFDYSCQFILGIDPVCLSTDFSKLTYEKYFNDIEDIIFRRHIVPQFWWKLERWLQIGEEKKYTRSSKILEEFVYRSITLRREEHLLAKTINKEASITPNLDILTACIKERENFQEIGHLFGNNSDKFLRDMTFSLLAAGKSTVSVGLSWFFWLIATKPLIQNKILEELREKYLPIYDQNGSLNNYNAKEYLNNLVYLHAALCETLRLYPPIPVNHRASIEGDTLPSGHQVKPNQSVLLSFYAMGRREDIWGEDCLEFKPERWISYDDNNNNGGKIINVPSYKFTAFNSGPRTCLGKDMGFVQMKIVVISILMNYEIHVVEGQDVSPGLALVLTMKHGLKVRVSKRLL